MKRSQAGKRPVVAYEGRFVRYLIRDGWEYVERTNCTGVVIILAVTETGRLVFTEQYRIPVGRSVIEFPAGLVGDTKPGAEDVTTAARRELLEETGYEAQRLTPLVGGPTSAGLTAEMITLVQATGLRKRSAGGGDSEEAITVHEVPLADVATWLKTMEVQGKLVDPKVYAGLYLLKHRGATSTEP